MAATYFSSLALAHVWWFLLYFNAPSDFRLLGVVICQMLDYTLVFLTTMGTLLSMLQDSRRPFWPTIVMALVILAFLLVAYIFSVDIHLASFIAGAAMILFIVITMLRYLVQYSRWLRDNYSDLEHKEVWQIFFVIASLMIFVLFYNMTSGSIIGEIIFQIIEMAFILYLLWQVEQLQTLVEPDIDTTQSDPIVGDATKSTDNTIRNMRCCLSVLSMASMMLASVSTSMSFLSRSSESGR